MSNIAFTFLNGEGVPVDKYKTLEWLIKCGNRPDKVKELNQEGVHLGEVDKNKTIHRLINEAHDSLREVRIKRESELEQEMENLRKEYQKLQTESQQKLKENEDTITLLCSLVQSKMNEIDLLQKDNQRLRNLEQRD